MADRYWVGGTGTWNATSTTNWSTTSGGTGGASVPTSEDDVYINANSGTGTIALSSSSPYPECRSLDFTGYTGSLQGVFVVYVYGNLIISSGMTLFGTILWQLVGTGSWSVTTNGKTLYRLIFANSSGSWTLTDNLTLSNNFQLSGGTVNTNNNNITITSGAFYCNGTNVCTLNLGSSIINLNGIYLDFNNPNLTLNAGTSLLNINSAGTLDYIFGNHTWYDIHFTESSAGTTSIRPILGNFTCHNLTLAGVNVTSSAVTKSYLFNSTNITITGTLTANGDEQRRINILSGLNNTTITAAALSISYVNFWRITGAGAASWSGTSFGNIGYNSGITFTSPKTVYFNYPTGGDFLTYGTPKFATSSGGTTAIANNPLPQDTVIIDNTGLNTSASLGAETNYFFCLPNIDFSSRTNAFTLNLNNIFVTRSLTFPSVATISNTGSVFFLTESSKTFDPNGKTITFSLINFGYLSIGSDYVSSRGCTLYNSSTMSTNSDIFISTGYNINMSGNYTQYGIVVPASKLILGPTSVVTTPAFNLNSNTIEPSSTSFDNPAIILTGNGQTIFTGGNGQTISAPLTIVSNYSGSTGTRTITPNSPTEANAISFNITAGSDFVSIGGSSKDINFTGFSGTLLNSSRTIYGSLTLSTGMTLTTGTSVTTFGTTSGVKTITTNGKTLDFPIDFNGVGGTWQLQDNLLQGSTRNTRIFNGTVDLNGKTYTVGSFIIGSGTKNLTFNGGILVCPAVTTTAFNNGNPTNFTTTAGTGVGKISMTGATDKTFVGGGSTYNCTLENAGAGALTISGSNIFTTISNSVQPTTFTFTSGTTQTVTNFNVSGNSGNLVTIGSTSASKHTLSKSSGVVDVSYCSISNSTVTGGATWQAYTINGNIDGGNNSGWKFSPFTSNGLLFGSNF